MLAQILLSNLVPIHSLPVKLSHQPALVQFAGKEDCLLVCSEYHSQAVWLGTSLGAQVFAGLAAFA